METYGSMSRREKASLILEQMRLCLAKQDFMRTQIIAKKINVKFFTDENDEETQALKLKYYEYVCVFCVLFLSLYQILIFSNYFYVQFNDGVGSSRRLAFRVMST